MSLSIKNENTSLLNFQGNIQRYNTGVGVSLTNDAIGFQRNNNLTVNLAHHIKTPVGVLSGGIGIGIINVGFSPTWIPPQTKDELYLPNAVSGTSFDANLGLHWQGRTKPYYVGISTTHVVPST